jgi:hypothetical protein
VFGNSYEDHRFVFQVKFFSKIDITFFFSIIILT